MADKSVDLILTDPPYGINVGKPIKREREREFKSAGQSRSVIVGIKGFSLPKVIGDLMTGKSPQKKCLTR
jgi:DNA modification methylase